MPPLRVVLLRHADAVNGAEAGSDFARVLTRKGEAQARRIGRALLAHGFLPDAVAASPAPRALQTAQLAVAAAGSSVPVVPDRALYEATAADLLAAIRRHGGETLWVVGHNPGLEEVGELLEGTGGWRLGKASAGVLEIARSPLGPGTARRLAWVTADGSGGPP